MTIALTGGTGFVGQAVLDEAARQGLSVRALTRRVQPPRPGVEWISGELSDPDALDDLVRGVEAVLHVAGVISASPEGFTEGNVRGTQNVVAAAQGAGVGRFVLVSSLAAREPGLSAYGASKREGERIVEASRLEWTIVRPPAVYGPRDTQILDLFKAARRGIVPMPPQGRASVIHVRDLASLLIALLPGGAGLSGRIFEPDDGHEGGWRHAELAKAIGAAVGRKVWAPAVPAGIVAAAARLDPLVRGERAKLTPDRASYLLHPDWACDPARRVPASLWAARIPTHDGLRETAAWYREQSWL